MDVHVAPRSLYLSQLKDRLGIDAVMNIAGENQFKQTTLGNPLQVF
ncbi:MAG: hypothetical protein GT600_15835 [Bacteroidales bacterium]|jgi:hypothetical protein|nr:hypothetical protein [Bacteroidales bacterium]NMD03093.1 hypothetical protein [Bacteroidales bacterium]OQB64105.1 MAG: hypothetical protein BWX96_00879 [Bacteroidetes bacterium ADurb.Bin145]HOU02441.1 hypothetical protein [Bacteroidales bacterium]HQK67930.1 hypothetical protein [Bacteroidales bacterium]